MAKVPPTSRRDVLPICSQLESPKHRPQQAARTSGLKAGHVRARAEGPGKKSVPLLSALQGRNVVVAKKVCRSLDAGGI